MSHPTAAIEKPRPPDCNAALVLADGTVFWGRGLGATGQAVGEVCFNTSITGYQEILTDPSYAGQIISFTFPHIGNVGTNPEDIESINPAARGVVLRGDITEPANWRAAKPLDDWLKGHNLPGVCGVDTRAITRRIRDGGAPSGVVVHSPDGKFDIPGMRKLAEEWPGLDGMDLAVEVTTKQTYQWDETKWALGKGYGKLERPKYHVVAVDYGAKRNILRCLANTGCKVTVVPATATAEDIMRHKPDGVFLSNGPGDPAATAHYSVPAVQGVLDKKVPLFGICLGHQILALTLGGKTRKMERGHRGANQPVKDLTTGKVEITSQNHGFCVVPESLPETAEVTHVSLFDGTNEGLRCTDKPAFSVQYHPEASPGPTDSHYLFDRFVDMIDKSKGGK
jgi:carbamoyl-phosphate synthase small subunit